MSSLQKTTGYVLATVLIAILLGSALAAPAFSAYADKGKPKDDPPKNNSPPVTPHNDPPKNNNNHDDDHKKPKKDDHDHDKKECKNEKYKHDCDDNHGHNK